jgi:hypothetical protein
MESLHVSGAVLESTQNKGMISEAANEKGVFRLVLSWALPAHPPNWTGLDTVCAVITIRIRPWEQVQKVWSWDGVLRLDVFSNSVLRNPKLI